jgi:hypothetical protein
MDPIRPISPPERDIDPVVRVTRTSKDREQSPREQPERQPRRKPAPPSPAELPPSDESGGLIDIKV